MIYPNLAAEMKRLGLSVQDLARVAGCSPDTIRNWMKGKGDFTVGTAIAVWTAYFPSSSFIYLFSKEPIVQSEVNQKAAG